MYFMPIGVTLSLMLLPGILMAIRCVHLAEIWHLLFIYLYALQSIRTVEQEHPHTLCASNLLDNANRHRRMDGSVARRET